MNLNTFFVVLGVLAFLFVFGCSNETAVDDPTSGNAVVSISAAGDGDEISIDDDSNCDSPDDPSQSDPGDHSDNSLCPETAFVIWVHESDGAFDSEYWYRICDNGSKKDCTDQRVLCSFVSCGTEWRAYTTSSPSPGGGCGPGQTLLTPDSLGSRTAQVFNDLGVKIGSDSFLITNSCTQTGD